MSAGGPVLLTGATGFVGMEVLSHLLERTQREVIALVRAPDAAAARERLAGALEQLFGDRAAYAGRVDAVPGDITVPDLGLEPEARAALAARVRAVIHSAASVTFDLPLDEARTVNVEGTRRVLDFARRAAGRGGLDAVVHVSTAYVAGTHAGRFGEDDLDLGQGFRNSYERSKLEAETLVREQAADLPVRIVRPSITVGESSTGWTSSFNVLYFPLQAFARGLARTVPADPAAPVDVVPVDHVADGVLAALSSAGPVTLNLVAGDRSPLVGEIASLAAARFGKPDPLLVPPEQFDASELGGAGESALEQLEVYFPYFSVATRFDDSHARDLGLRAPRFDAYFDRLVEFAEAARWGKRSLGRPRGASAAAA